MNYCSGGTLLDMLNNNLENTLTEKALLEIFYQLSKCIDFCHSLNPPIIHRDIKLENFLIIPPKKYLLCDFGSATTTAVIPLSEKDRGIISEDLEKNTTLSYRAPEMIDLYQEKYIDEKSDIWALGCLLYKMFYKVTPFEDGSKLAIINAQFTYPSKPETSSQLKNLIKIILNPNPDTRPDI